MKIKLFGKELFEFSGKKSDLFMLEVNKVKTDSKFLPDFYKQNGSDWAGHTEWANVLTVESVTAQVKAVESKKRGRPAKKDKKIDVKLTPKGAYHLRLLNQPDFILNTDPEYVDGQLADFKDKLGLLTSEEYDMRRGVEEVSSMVQRLENRKKYPEHSEFFAQYPYTTTSKIVEVTTNHDNLKCGQIAQFVADLPKEAVDVMKAYNKETKAICDKEAVFYIIADKKDFQKSIQRRDPILLAQSPFGHVWQILGAWDDEMLFLEEL